MVVRVLVTMSFLAAVGGRYSTPSRAPCAFAAPFSRCVAQAISHPRGRRRREPDGWTRTSRDLLESAQSSDVSVEGRAHPRAGRVPRMMLPGEDGWRSPRQGAGAASPPAPWRGENGGFSESVHAAGWLRGGGGGDNYHERAWLRP